MEAMERRGKIVAVAALFYIVFSSQYPGVWAGKNSTKMSYVCPPQFIRLGHSCYFFSENKATWQNALFACKDRESNLSVPARWEDRNLRKYLNKPDIEKASRWIGGIYDYPSRAWKWGGELKSMHYQSFSKMKRLSPDQLQWHCIAMMPELLYRWAPRSCIETRQFICQTKLRKVSKAKLKDLTRKWQRMGVINEITAPSVSREVNNRRPNDVTVNPVLKSYDLRPSQLRMPRRKMPRNHRNVTTYFVRPKKRSRLVQTGPVHPRRRMAKLFPGYYWDRRDPEASYHHNEKILRSGRLNFTPQQINSYLARLRHMRDRQIQRPKRLRDQSDWLENDTQPALAHSHARTYTVDNNISALHPKTIVEEFDMPMPAPVVRAHRAIG
ncbi:hypothetical protein O0L34_g16185 [Tuta absoluta]|nr:hypothetical protein O0L34_g16185 [Tuta absoluta]